MSSETRNEDPGTYFGLSVQRRTDLMYGHFVEDAAPTEKCEVTAHKSDRRKRVWITLSAHLVTSLSSGWFRRALPTAIRAPTTHT